MTGRLPWVAATLVAVIVAGMGAWALSIPPAQFATIKAVPSELSVSGKWFTPGWFTAAEVTAAENSGIENVYIVDNYWDEADFENVNLGENGVITDPDNVNMLLAGSTDAVITGNNDNAEIPYESPFKIVVAVRVEADADEWAPKRQRRLAAYVNEDNMYVFLDWSPSTDVGETYNVENSELTGDGPSAYERWFALDSDVSWTKNDSAYDGFDGTIAEPNDWARINVVFCNANKDVYATPPETGSDEMGFRLAAGSTMTLDNIDLWVWA
jgi:hypothetical protein